MSWLKYNVGDEVQVSAEAFVTRVFVHPPTKPVPFIKCNVVEVREAGVLVEPATKFHRPILVQRQEWIRRCGT